MKQSDFKVVSGYEMLAQVLQDAHDQAAIGKGDERHANGLPFHEQRMQNIATGYDSPLGMAFQVEKKMREGLQFDDHERRERELLGAINYLAGIAIFYRLRQPSDAVKAAHEALVQNKALADLASAVEKTKEEFEVLLPENWPAEAEARAERIMQNGNTGEHYNPPLTLEELQAGGWKIQLFELAREGSPLPKSGTQQANSSDIFLRNKQVSFSIIAHNGYYFLISDVDDAEDAGLNNLRPITLRSDGFYYDDV